MSHLVHNSDPRPPVVGVSACIFRARKVLLVKRARGPYEGLWSLPGGRVSFGERLEAAVRREVEEETGINLPRYAFYCLHEAIEAAAGIHAVIAVHRAAQELPVGIEPDAGDDARAAVFHDVDKLAAMDADKRLTGGLAEIVASAHRSHLLGL
ncbi:hypothetical protein ASG43_00735 [Aureimonas sp. Leaf454]|uniref:NUDIX domain-containing protein n=1 Tax=Aureimonas sp. Leaf454 TaxID=1736381 RepID=UPI0006F3BC74|nr:NUDIX domain-containing protein [Aureimonas sp. Leaf454]KQT54191.1 hypothetical protein ASG43_00735 [Aureimonas sp. Leaf454]